MAKEIELKLNVTPEAIQIHLDELCVALKVKGLVCFKMTNRYFDTPALMLKSQRIALRIREFDGHIIQTLKTAGSSKDGMHVRGEWEWSLDKPELNLEYLLEVDAWPKNVELDTLRPIFETNFTRRQANILWKETEVEWVIDEGEVVAGDEQSPICEMELELKKGSPDRIFEIEKEMAKILLNKMSRSDISKGQRGYQLVSRLI